MFKIAIGLLTLISLNAFAAPNAVKVDCTYTQSFQSFASIQFSVVSDTTAIDIEWPKNGFNIDLQNDFDISEYIIGVIANRKIQNGQFVAVRRIDSDHILLHSVSGKIVNGKVTNVATVDSDFGAPEQIITFSSTQVPGLVCGRHF